MKRRIPENREGLKQVRQIFGTKWEEPLDYATLTDPYWLKKKSSRKTWEQVNFYTNRYSEDIGKMFYSPWELDPKQSLDFKSPDLCTDGILKKRWKQKKDGTSSLIKSRSKALNQEPIYEVLASKFIKEQGINCVNYHLVTEGVEICAACDNFTNENTELVPASHIYFLHKKEKNETVYSHLLKECEELGLKDAKVFIDDMINVDRAIGNQDRHLNNFGFLRDTNSREFIGPAPLYDSGSSFGDIANLINPNKEKADNHQLKRGCFKNVDVKKKKWKQLEYYQYENIIKNYPFISDTKKENFQKYLKNFGREAIFEIEH